jgi:hypothetical protein
MIKRGDTFINEPIDLSDIGGGTSPQQPMVITYYGSSGELPLLKTGSGDCIQYYGNSGLSHLAVVGVDCYAHTRDPYSPGYTGYAGGSGIVMVGGGHVDDVLFEGITLRFYVEAITLQVFQSTEPFHNIALRGNILYKSWAAFGSGQGYGQGIYAWNLDGVLLEGNKMIDVGLNAYQNDPTAIVPPDISASAAAATWYAHHAYFDRPTVGVVLKNNIIWGGDGIQCRSGCEAYNNYFFRTIVGLAGGNDDDGYTAGGMTLHAQNNVFNEGTGWPDDSTTAGDRAFGMELTNLKVDSEISTNLFVNDISPHPSGFAVHLKGTACNGNSATPCPIQGAKVNGNKTYNWGAEDLVFEGTPGTEINSISVDANTFVDTRNNNPILTTFYNAFNGNGAVWQNNRYFSAGAASNWFKNGTQGLSFQEWLTMTHEIGGQPLSNLPTITYGITDYAQSIGVLPNIQSIEQYLLQQNPLHWDPKVEAININAAFVHQYEF